MLVIFDVDGTLVDSQAIIVAAQQQTFASLALPPPSRERALSIVGLSLPEAFTALVGPDGPVAALVEAYRTTFHRLRAEGSIAEPLFPGAAETIAALAAREDVRLGIATGKARRGVAHLVAREGWEGVFATVQTADDAPSKPHPAMIEQAMAETGASRADTLMVGDTTFDMAMARGAEVGAVGVAWGYHAPDALLAAGARTLVGSFAELLALIEARLTRAA